MDPRRRDAASDPFRHARMFRSVSGMSNSKFVLSWLRHAALGSGLRTKAVHDSSACSIVLFAPIRTATLEFPDR